MTALDDLTVAVELACLTTDRTDAEQRALLRVARRVDSEANANVVGNARYWGMLAGSTVAVLQRRLCTLEMQVDETRVVGERQNVVALPAKIPAGRHRPARCEHLDGGCGYPADHPIHVEKD